VENVYRRTKSLPDCGVSLDPSGDEFIPLINSCTSRKRSYSLDEVAEEDVDIETLFFGQCKESKQAIDMQIQSQEEDCWSSFEIGKALNL